MKEKNYFSVFAKMPKQAKVFTIQQALSCPEQQAKEILEKLENELKRQEALLKLAHRRTTEKIREEADHIAKIRAIELRKRREGEKEKKIRLRYYWDIKELRQEGYGWRKIAEYLAKRHKFKISHNGLKKAYLKVQKQIEGDTVNV